MIKNGRNPWKWFSIALLAVLALVLILCGPCGPCRERGDRGSGERSHTTAPEPGVEGEPAASPQIPSGVSPPSRPTAVRRTDRMSTPARRSVPAPPGDAAKDGSRTTAITAEETTDRTKGDASPVETRPAPDPVPLTPEEYDFRTRIEIITDQAK